MKNTSKGKFFSISVKISQKVTFLIVAYECYSLACRLSAGRFLIHYEVLNHFISRDFSLFLDNRRFCKTIHYESGSQRSINHRNSKLCIVEWNPIHYWSKKWIMK